MYFAILAVSAALAQANKAVPPPPKPADDGPSLEATMKFVQDKINGQGAITYHVTFDGGDFDWIQQPTVSADPGTCRLKGSERAEADRRWDKMARTYTYAFSFQDVKQISVEDYTAWRNHLDGTGATTAPPVFVLLLSAELAAFNKKVKGKDEKVRELTFFFVDEDMANRVAKAMLHGVELCGGGGSKPEPF